jgi:tryptophan-rich hypothetical protein
MALSKRYQRLVGSKWTSAAEVEGWRHFHVVSLERGGGGYRAQLAASCDARVRAGVPAAELFDRARWTPGWTPLAQLRDGDGPSGG